MSETVKLVIDGKPCTCEKGDYLLEVAQRNGIRIPRMCYHEGLSGLGACRVCIVEVVEAGRSRVVTSCIYPVLSEIEVFTQNDKIKELRGMVLTLLARLAPNAEGVAKMAAKTGIELPRLAVKEGGDTCILCGRCVSACEALGSGAIAKVNRGVTKEIATPYGEPSSECIGCGSCAFVCPTDSIASERTEESFTIWGREFEMQRCSVCGMPFTTQAAFAFLQAAQAEWEPGAEQQPPLCEECGKKAVARQIANAGKYL